MEWFLYNRDLHHERVNFQAVSLILYMRCVLYEYSNIEERDECIRLLNESR